MADDEDKTDDQDEAAEAEAAEANEEAKPPEPTELETLAADMGWAPEDDWRGKSEDWVDAKTFIRSGPEILKTTLRKQDEQLAAIPELRDQVTRMARAQDAIQKQGQDQDLASLETQRRDAVGEGDTEAYDRLTAQIAEVSKVSAKPNGEAQPGDPHLQPFLGANPWYGDDIEMTAYAQQIAPVVGGKHQGAAFYDKLGEEIRKKFPAHFGNKARSDAPKVEGGGSTNRKPKSTGKKGYADLPAEAKAACDRYVEGGKSTKESYCKTYFGDET